MQTRNDGTYWRLAWSRDWKTRTPWTVDKKPTPYIGSTMTPSGMVIVRTLGPIALISVIVKGAD